MLHLIIAINRFRTKVKLSELPDIWRKYPLDSIMSFKCFLCLIFNDYEHVYQKKFFKTGCSMTLLFFKYPQTVGLHMFPLQTMDKFSVKDSLEHNQN